MVIMVFIAANRRQGNHALYIVLPMKMVCEMSNTAL